MAFVDRKRSLPGPAGQSRGITLDLCLLMKKDMLESLEYEIT
jgi:hypothetical protein